MVRKLRRRIPRRKHIEPKVQVNTEKLDSDAFESEYLKFIADLKAKKDEAVTEEKITENLSSNEYSEG